MIIGQEGFVGLVRNCYSAVVSYDLTPVLSTEFPTQKDGHKAEGKQIGHQHSDLRLKVTII
jgi:hypothetical protein